MSEDAVLTAVAALAESLDCPAVFQRDPLTVSLEMQSTVLDGALRNDPVLGLLANAPEPGVFIQASTGSGWRVQPSSVGFGIVSSAIREVVGRGLPTSEPGPLVRVLGDVLTRFRELIRGDSATALSLVGFEGFSLPGELHVETPWGTLRPVDPFEETFHPLVRTGAAGAVLVTEIPVQLTLGEPTSSSAAPTSMYNHSVAQALEQNEMYLSLALLLATYNGEGSPIADPIWHKDVIPGVLGHAFSARSTSPEWAPRPAVQIDSADQEEFRRWAELVDSHYDEAISIAVRRLTLAIHERTAPDDALIDAVMAAESLFGHGGTSEVSFRVSSAMAILMESTPEKRAGLRKAINDVYNARSTIVHGGALKSHERAKKRDLALTHAIGALRRLFEDCPDLISDKNRGMRLILGDF